MPGRAYLECRQLTKDKDLVWHKGPPIPTNLITGFLGTGKTTAIRDLLQRRPAGERWSVFINEYGMVSIDDLMLDETSPDVQIQELAGGCFCCTTSAMLDVVLIQFIRRTKPDRLLIEPSGAGHPARVIDTLRGPRFRDALDLRATICLVDPKDFDNPRVTNSEGFHDQIQMADVVALNWLDKRERSQIEKVRNWVQEMDPPKLLIAETQFGKLEPAWLDLKGTVVRTPHFAEPASHQKHEHDHDRGGQEHAAADSSVNLVTLSESATPGHPLRLANEGNGQRACGWIFHRDDIFDRDDLFDYLARLNPVQRVKGIFRCSDDWWLFNRTGNDVSMRVSAYRRDSRLEIITNDALPNWDDVEKSLRVAIVR